MHVVRKEFTRNSRRHKQRKQFPTQTQLMRKFRCSVPRDVEAPCCVECAGARSTI